MEETHQIQWRDIEWRKAKWCHPIEGRGPHCRLEMEINHPTYGWIPFTLDPTDRGAQFDTNSLFQHITTTAPDAIEEYVPPAPEEILNMERQHMIVSRFQFKTALLRHKLLGTVRATLNGAPDELQLAWEEAELVTRFGPIVTYIVAQVADIDDATMDDIFREAVAVKS